jgi:Holliday junction resolvase RusA-like endonuclease
MTYKVVIKGKFHGNHTAPGWNDRISASATHPKAGGRMEKDFVMVCANHIRTQLKRAKIEKPIRITYVFHESDKRRDLGNISYIDKPFEDALQICKVLENDNQTWVKELHFILGETDKLNPQIEITIEEIDDEM